MKATPLVTRESLQKLIDEANDMKRMHIIGRALVQLFYRQTESEKIENETKVTNGVGFAGCDAKSGTLTAKSYKKHQTLQPWQVEKWTRKGTTGFSRICKYASQLNEIAIEKARQQSLTLE